MLKLRNRCLKHQYPLRNTNVSGPGGAREVILTKMIEFNEIHQISLNLAKIQQCHENHNSAPFAKPIVIHKEY